MSEISEERFGHPNKIGPQFICYLFDLICFDLI
jgi:hypothetical protein